MINSAYRHSAQSGRHVHDVRVVFVGHPSATLIPVGNWMKTSQGF